MPILGDTVTVCCAFLVVTKQYDNTTMTGTGKCILAPLNTASGVKCNRGNKWNTTRMSALKKALN